MSLYVEVNALRNLAYDYDLLNVIEEVEYDFGFGVLDTGKKESYWTQLEAQNLYNFLARRVNEELNLNKMKIEKDKKGKWRVAELT
jgi:hypothetical protein